MDQPSPANEAELRSELDRLAVKISETLDADIHAALALRIEQIRALLKNHVDLPSRADKTEDIVALEKKQLAEDPVELQSNLKVQAEAIGQTLSRADEAALRAELQKVSAQRYITEDPELRARLQERIVELQQLLGIDIAKLAGGELTQQAAQETTRVSQTKSQSKKAKTDLAELQALVAEKSAQIRRTENTADVDIPSNPEPPTPDQAEAAERLVQQARVEKMRGNKQEVRRLLEQAVQKAPGSPTVLEIVGDDYAERKQVGKALAYYRRAATLDPKNVNLERKVALAALGFDAAGTLDQQLSTNLGGGIDESAIPMASSRAALLLSLFLPGLGHIVLGRRSKGWTILAIWCLMLGWSILMGGDIAKLGSLIIGGKSHPNLLVVVPLFVMFVVYFSTLADFRGAKESSRKPVERPTPPVNLPFE